jgi:hypothetical protein
MSKTCVGWGSPVAALSAAPSAVVSRVHMFARVESYTESEMGAGAITGMFRLSLGP